MKPRLPRREKLSCCHTESAIRIAVIRNRPRDASASAVEGFITTGTRGEDVGPMAMSASSWWLCVSLVVDMRCILADDYSPISFERLIRRGKSPKDFLCNNPFSATLHAKRCLTESITFQDVVSSQSKANVIKLTGVGRGAPWSEGLNDT